MILHRWQKDPFSKNLQRFEKRYSSVISVPAGQILSRSWVARVHFATEQFFFHGMRIPSNSLWQIHSWLLPYIFWDFYWTFNNSTYEKTVKSKYHWYHQFMTLSPFVQFYLVHRFLKDFITSTIIITQNNAINTQR